MKRILHVLASMNRGGAETFIMNVYRHIDRTQFQFDFLLHQKDNDYEAEIKELGGDIYVIPSRRELGVIKYFRALNAFFRIQSGKYGAVHQHLSSLSSIEPLIVSKRYNIPIRIIHSHNSNQRGKLHHLLHFINKPFISIYANRFLACSNVALQWLYNYTLVKNKAIVVKNGIDVNLFRFNTTERNRIRKNLQIEEDEVLFGHVGRFNAVKNHEFIIEIFYQYIHKYGKAKLILIGQGELLNQVKKQVESLNLNGLVMFLGLRTDISSLLQAMDIFIFPSIYEGLPVALVEAQSAGVKVYCSAGVSIESKLTPNIEFYSLEWSAQKWAEYIHNSMSYTRNSTDSYVRDSGYDISNTTDLLVSVYCEK